MTTRAELNNNKSAYESNLDLFIQYFRNPHIRNRSRARLEDIARELIDVRVRVNETKRTAVRNVHLDLIPDTNIDIFEFAAYLDEETNAIARNLAAWLFQYSKWSLISLFQYISWFTNHGSLMIVFQYTLWFTISPVSMNCLVQYVSCFNTLNGSLY